MTFFSHNKSVSITSCQPGEHQLPTSRQAHSKLNKAGLTHVAESKACQSIFPETDKGGKQLDKTWNLLGGTRQFRIYGYKTNQNDI
jgi:hypothetical protein